MYSGLSTPVYPDYLTGDIAACQIAGVLSLGQEIRRLREARGLTQDQVAKAVGHAKPGKVSLWENDERRPSKDNQTRLADVLGVTVEHLRQFGQPYDPSEPRRTRRQRAERPDPPFPLRGNVGDMRPETLRQRALEAEPSGGYTVTGSPTDLFISHSHGGDPPEYLRRVFEGLLTETTSLIHLVGPRGMVIIWRLVDILHTHREHRDELIPAIDAVLTELDGKYRNP